MDFTLTASAQSLSSEQKSFLSGTLKIDPERTFTMRQVHGRRVLTVTAADFPQMNIPEADAMVTNVPGIVLSVRTADCLPVFLCDSRAKCIGLVHAGWKSSSLNIVAETLKVMTDHFGSRSADVVAVFGPAIQGCCYEVGEEFQQTFSSAVFRRGSKMYLDLPAVNKKQLCEAGVRESHIAVSAECTVCGRGYHSFRRDKEKSGRHLSLLMIKK